MVRHVFTCPVHGDFERRRPMAEGGKAAPCPDCQAGRADGESPLCRQVVRFDPARQIHLPNKFRTDFGTTGLKSSYGGGDWEKMTGNGPGGYHRWDSDFAGPIPNNDCPDEMR